MSSSTIHKASVTTKIAPANNLVPPVDPDKVLRKLDLYVLAPACIMYGLAFLDRTNLGNTKIAGLVSDLGLTGVQFNLCVAGAMIPYSLLEVPSNIALKRIGPSRWLPLIMLVWGAVCVSMAFARNFAGLVTARVFLGAVESGILPGLTYYLCAWYPKSAQAKRIGVMYSGALIANAFGGLLAYAIEKMNGIGGIPGWSWIFILEGLLTILVATIFYFCMLDRPESAIFLTEIERNWLLESLKSETAGGSKQFKREFIIQALRDPQAYMFTLMFFFGSAISTSFSVFLPVIINSLGYSPAHAQLLSIPPNIAGCLSTYAASYFSDKTQIRGPFVIGGSLVAISGYIMLITTRTVAVQYAGTVFVAAGIYPIIATLLAWSGGNFSGELKRAVVISLVIGCGNIGGIAASFIYRQQDSPRYLPGHATCIASLTILTAVCPFVMFRLRKLNKRKSVQCEREGITADQAEAYAGLGDCSPLYRYTL